MSDYFARLPELVLRKIYGKLDNAGKLRLTEMCHEDNASHVLENAGVHNYKQRFFCFICQSSLLHTEFGLNEINRNSLGFNWLYKQVDSQERGPIRVVTHERRSNTLEDMEESDRILHYFESRLASVFSTKNMNELHQHLVRVHGPHDYLPAKYWEEINVELDVALNEAFNPQAMQIELLGLPFGQMDPQDAFLQLRADKRALQRSAVRVVTETARRFRTMHRIGGNFDQVYMRFGNKSDPELWEFGSAINSLREFIDVIENQHQVQLDIGLGGRTIGELKYNHFSRFFCILILAQTLLHRTAASSNMVVLLQNFCTGRKGQHTSMVTPDFAAPEHIVNTTSSPVYHFIPIENQNI